MIRLIVGFFDENWPVVDIVDNTRPSTAMAHGVAACEGVSSAAVARRAQRQSLRHHVSCVRQLFHAEQGPVCCFE